MKLTGSVGWLNVAQFLGTLNDNVFKLLVIFFITANDPARAAGAVSAVGFIFVLPFLLLAHIGGSLADRMSRRTVIVRTRVAEAVVAALGVLAFYFQSMPGLFAACFLMAAQSAIYGPSKYAILSEIVPKDRLAKANSLLVSCSFLAIIAGMPLAAGLRWLVPTGYAQSGMFCVLIALLGMAASLAIAKTPVHQSAGRRFTFLPHELLRTLGEARKDNYLFLTILGSGYFFLTAAFMQLNMIPYGMQVMGFSQEKSSCLFLLAAAGMGLGSILVGRLSGRNIEFGLVPVGAAGLTTMAAILSASPAPAIVFAATFILGICVGFFTVPLDTFLQMRSPHEQMGRTLAASSLVANIGVLLAAALVGFAGNVLKLSAAEAFLLVACLNLVLVVGAVIVLPDFLLRFIMVVIARMFYRMRVSGLENVPVDGGALLVSNHVTLVDALLISATLQRRISFIMFRETYEHSRWLKPLFKLMRVIPIAAGDPPRKLLASLKQARQMLDEGRLVCIFPEGSLTRTGTMGGFRPGFERIVRGTDYPVIPIYLGGAWGSIFSHQSGKPLSALPAKLPYPVWILFGRPLPRGASANDARSAVSELSGDWFNMLKPGRKSLGALFVCTARRHWRRFAMSDASGKHLTCGQMLTASVAIAREIGKLCRKQDKVGILFPPCVAGALANTAVAMLGKVPVNLNYTAPAGSVASAIGQCKLAVILTSREFVARLKGLALPDDMVFLEDITSRLTPFAKAVALFRALFLPCRYLVSDSAFHADKPATVIFSSGTTGEPKGVVLSHHNIISNVEAFGMVFRFSRDDGMCAALPFFHSFGFTCTLWFPIITGLPVRYHPNPLDGDGIAGMVREGRCSVLLSTPTFLLMYLRRAKPEDFASLRYVITGAEKLGQRIAESFRARFGIMPLEGYGTTELSPVVSINVPDFNVDGEVWQGARPGSIGRTIPGVTARIADPGSGETLPVDKEGLLYIKGPNVMLGYLDKPEKTADVIRDGWYDTGDMARIDGDGFITITGRTSRFSKVGGEMVPHAAVEEAILNGLPPENRGVVVTGVPDEKRGERLMVFFTPETGTAEELQAILHRSGLPNLWKPRREDYIKIAAIPVLGSGKLDLKSIRALALNAAVSAQGDG